MWLTEMSCTSGLMSKKAIIIQGSSRSKGNTALVVNKVLSHCHAEKLDLNCLQIHPYDYEYRHMDDDFIPAVEKILKYDILVFATPVYWYSMSGIMKNFFDRITDLLKKRKDLGYQLRGKSMMVIRCGSEEALLPEFIAPFVYSAEYLDMKFGGHLHTWIENGEIPEGLKEEIECFAGNLQ